MSHRHTTALTGLTFALGVLPTTLASALLHHRHLNNDLDHNAHIAAAATVLHARQDSPPPLSVPVPVPVPIPVPIPTDLLSSAEPPLPPASTDDIPKNTFTIVPSLASSDDGSTPLPTIGPSPIPGFNPNGNGSYAVPNFPTSTVLEAVARVCPNATAGGLFTILPFPFASSGLESAQQQQQSVNATASSPLPDGLASALSSSVTVSASASTVAGVASSEEDAAAARVSFGADGCQTLYTPTAKAVCSTTISLLGLPVVTVTECAQWVTFSSLVAERAAETGSGVPAEGATTDQGAGQDPVKRQQIPSVGEGNSITTPAAAVDSLQIPPPTASPSPSPGTYYAVPWYDAVRGGVPSRVRAVECGNDDVVGGGGVDSCSTWEESWSETVVVRTVSEERGVAFSGPVVFADGASTYTTTISIATVTSTTRVTASPSVVKRRLFLDGDRDGTRTVRMTATLTETEYISVATSAIGGVRTVELVEGPGASAV